MHFTVVSTNGPRGTLARSVSVRSDEDDSAKEGSAKQAKVTCQMIPGRSLGASRLYLSHTPSSWATLSVLFYYQVEDVSSRLAHTGSERDKIRWRLSPVMALMQNPWMDRWTS
ncbi:hypothetical protein KM043_016712 [Ampulex compressa]|nr:hypothetical protein KM043_016712 [Ampulex compressa]